MKAWARPGLQGHLQLHPEGGGQLIKHCKQGCDIVRFMFLTNHTGCEGENRVEEGGPDTGRLVRVESTKRPLLLPPAMVSSQACPDCSWGKCSWQ